MASTKIRYVYSDSPALQNGYGVPDHIEPKGSIYVDYNDGIVYVNKDGLVDWAPLTDGKTTSLLSVTEITISSFTLTTSFNYYGVNYNGNVNLTLPNPSLNDGFNLNIKDEGGYSGTYRIRITSPIGTIDNNPYVDMNSDNMSLHMVARNNNWWII
jgi:hypothetical protein